MVGFVTRLLLIKGKAAGREAVKLSCCFLLTVMLLIAPAARVQAAEAEPEGTAEVFELDAEKLTFENETGIATAEGNVHGRGGDMQLFAPAAVYDTRLGLITASAEGDKKITLMTGEVIMDGESLEYNVNTRQGTVTQPSGKMDAIFFKGGKITVMPLEEAARQKLIARVSAKATRDDTVAFWSDASSTTCDSPDPHYRLVTKKAVIFPNRKAVLKKPRVYMGEKMVFQYPFDYIIPLREREQTFALMPRIMYDSDRGGGLGLSGPFTWDSGQIDIQTVFWSDNIWEAILGIRQSVGRDFTLFANTNRLYNKDDKYTLWRPSWGVEYHSLNGWSAKLYESQRELLETEMRPGRDRRYNVWRSPEFTFSSPWYKIIPAHFFNFSGIWGKYQDNVTYDNAKAERVGGRVRIYGEPKVGISFVQPFYNASYRYFHYDIGEKSQKVTDMITGIRWHVGELNMATAYVRRWVDGRSPLTWDRYLDREDIYHQVSFSIPGTIEGEKWDILVRAGYDYVDDKLNEMVYGLSYNKHCLTWQLYAKDSRPKNEVSVGLRFIVNAYPDQALELGEVSIFNPFGRPVPRSAWNK